MVIEFICPNGHQLTAPDEQAGKPGKCPKCNTSFLVPSPEEVEEDHEPAAQTAAADDQDEQEIFVFLCPNGHRLNGPVSLKGRPGQCPHCGAKFRIPDDEDEEEGEPEEVEGLAEPLEGFPQLVEVVDEPGVPLVQAARRWQSPPPPRDGGYTVAELFTWLWEERDDSCVVEIRLRDGEIFTPRQFAPQLSQGEHAVFASRDDFGKYTVTTIAWENVTRVGVRNLPSLPLDLFQ